MVVMRVCLVDNFGKMDWISICIGALYVRVQHAFLGEMVGD